MDCSISAETGDRQYCCQYTNNGVLIQKKDFSNNTRHYWNMPVRGLQKECHVVPRQFVQFESEQSCLGKRSKSMPTKVSAVSPLQTYVFPMQKRGWFLCVNFTILDSFLPKRPESSLGIYACKVKWVLAEHHPDLSVQIPFRCLGWTKRRNEWACRIAAVCQVWASVMSQCPKTRLRYIKRPLSSLRVTAVEAYVRACSWGVTGIGFRCCQVSVCETGWKKRRNRFPVLNREGWTCSEKMTGRKLCEGQTCAAASISCIWVSSGINRILTKPWQYINKPPLW